MSITVTEKAANEVKKVMEEQKMSPLEHVLEVGVMGGGCSGYQYKLGFKERKEVDSLNETMFNFHGIDVAVGNRSLLYLEGATVDFHEDINRRGFVFNNPNSKTTCGCGQSFSA